MQLLFVAPEELLESVRWTEHVVFSSQGTLWSHMELSCLLMPLVGTYFKNTFLHKSKGSDRVIGTRERRRSGCHLQPGPPASAITPKRTFKVGGWLVPCRMWHHPGHYHIFFPQRKTELKRTYREDSGCSGLHFLTVCWFSGPEDTGISHQCIRQAMRFVAIFTGFSLDFLQQTYGQKKDFCLHCEENSI